MLSLLAFVALFGCACEGTTGRDAVSDEHGELIDLGASWTTRGGDEATACEVVATASEWRAMQVRLGDQPVARLTAPCDFTHERLVVVWLRAAAIEPPITTKVTTEEGVDVVVLAPAVTGGAATAERTLVHVFVAPARTGQLAVVARLPQAGQSVESTVAVIAPR
jgi:hypothetical protein